MKIYRNVVNDTTASILLYGEIADEWGDGKIAARSFVEELMYCDNNYRNVHIRINSVGGDVYPGIAIFNAIRQMKSEVTLFIDGIAASIAGVVAMCGKRVEMSKYARIMIHSVSGGCYGNKNDLQDMIATVTGLEDTISEIISARCGITKEEIKEKYFDGADHWLLADEAINMKLIDAIYDADPIPDASTTDEIYKLITNRLTIVQPKTEDNMKLEDLKKIPRFANCADETAVLAAMNETAARADQADALEAENAVLRAAQAEAEAEATAADTAAVEAAVKDGRISAEQKEVYQNLLKVDRKNGRAALAGLKPKNMVRTIIEQGAGGGDDASAWEKKQSEIRNSIKR